MIKVSIPSTAFNLFGIDIKWYAILYVFAFELSIRVALYQIKRNYSDTISCKQFTDFMYMMLPIMIIGARIGHVVFFDLEYYITHPNKIINIRDGGLSFHGGLLAIALYVILYAREKKIPMTFLSDILCYCGSIALAVGRCGNFINQELYGVQTSSIFGVIFCSVDNIPRHPVQLYEALTEGVLNFVILSLLHTNCKNKCGNLVITSTFLMVYSIARLCIDFLKYDAINNKVLPGQILSVILLFMSVALFIIKRRFNIVGNRDLVKE